MVIIKIYSQDMYVAGLISHAHSEELASLLEVDVDDLYFVAGEGTLVYRGADQTGWYTYLEISIQHNILARNRQALEKALHKIFSDYGVHLLIKYNFFDDDNVTRIIDPDYPLFTEAPDTNILDNIGHKHSDDDEEEESDYNKFVMDSFFDEDYDENEEEDDE